MNALVYTAASGEKSNHTFLIADCALECYPKRKVTYLLSTSECISSHSSKWRKEQPFIFNHTSCVRMVSKYNMKVTYRLSTSECMSSHSSKWRKEQPFILNHTSCVGECYQKRKVTYRLSTSECMSSHSGKWRKEQPCILNRRSCVRMLSKEESNLPTEHK